MKTSKQRQYKKEERKFQSSLIREIKERFPGSMVLKNDPNYIQGIPDLLVLYNKRWASLECKRSSSSTHQPNQDYYVDKMNKMSFSRFIFPENKEEVLDDLEQSFKS
jgi:hypothetical protein